MKKLLILGSHGMAGHMVYNYLFSLKKYEIENIDIYKLNDTTIIIDVREFDKLKNKIEELKPDVIINCIGILVENSSRNPKLAILLNSYLPHFLAELGRKLNYSVIHLSTDCVFSGKKGDYFDSDFRDGDTIYARSKALGELDNNYDLTIRTSIIGPELTENGSGLFHWFMSTTDSEVLGFSKVMWTGITTLELGKQIDFAIVNNITGLYNVVPSEKISKFDLLNLIKNIFKSETKIKKSSSYCSDKSLINSKKEYEFRTKNYYEMLIDLKNWIKNLKYSYKY